MAKIKDKLNKSPRIDRSEQDFLLQLKKQYKFLCRSLHAVVAGDYDEIDRIALTIRILCHTRRKCHGLLSQLNTDFQVLDTCPEIPQPPLVFLREVRVTMHQNPKSRFKDVNS